MPDIEKLHLEDTLEDSPQTRSLLSVFEKDALGLKKYTSNLHSCCQRVMSAQNELCSATQGLAQQLRAYELQKFPLESDDSILTTTLKQFATYIDEVSSVQQVLSSQFSETMMYPLNKFLQADMEEISTMFEMFQIATHEHEQALNKYMKLPHKRDNEKARIDANDELYGMRKKFHQTSLHYYSCLNALQYKRKCCLLEPILGYFHAQRAYFQMGHDTVWKPGIEDFLGNIAASVQSVHQEMAKETQKTVELIDNIEKQSAHLYYAEPPIDMPFIPPNTALIQKAGYLYQKSKQALIASKWEKLYFFTQGGNLMSQGREEFAGSLVVDLNEDGVMAEPVTDDRRFVFQVVSANNKKCVLQAENYRERDEWIATINNIVRDSGYVRGRAAAKKKEQTPSIGSLRSQSSDGQPHPETASSVRRVNPFNQPGSEALDSANENLAFAQNFTVRFLGSMEVQTDRGEQLVHSTIRQIMAARAIHNVFKMTESRLLVTNESMRLIDPDTNTTRVEFALADISFWTSHPENNRLFGFITRSRNESGTPSFACHVFEGNTSSEEICQAISTATKIAFQALMEKRSGKTPTTDKEKKLLLQNTKKQDNQRDSEEEKLPLSPDGKFLILSSQDQSDSSLVSPDLNPLPREHRGDGDEREIEGAESEA
ncbi:DCC-interacting protein 13-alpha-like isoform X2 [Gigantopelta aegis]|uniref:DCC-interacting protein 13-alpha-like isoform X2 n=1 Tax=Gigantopelta aegis TaxID=1735272 RepID=UPI001B88D95C|nr:DCC-interacting protein 13-alpha-like isoform X2 [Gigantopelta aegis]